MVALAGKGCLHNRVANPKPPPGNASLAVLILANLLPVVGVLAWDWSVFEIVALYWFENVIIGAFNILKMLPAMGEFPTTDQRNEAKYPNENPEMPDYLRNPAAAGGMRHGIKLFLIPFFTVHYGMFCLVHGLFVGVLLGSKGGGITMSGGPFEGIGRMMGAIIGNGGKWFVLAIVASHLFSYLSNFIWRGEFRRISAPGLMMAPYGRIVVLHVAIIFGAFVITALGSPVFLLLLLIAGKIILDAKLHLRSHGKATGTPVSPLKR